MNLTNTKRFVFLLLVILTGFCYSCKEEDMKRSPKVLTKTVSEVTACSVSAVGEIIDLGEGIDDHGHCWGFNPAPNLTNNKNSLGPASGKSIYISVITGLEPEKNYYIRAYVKSNEEIFYGKEATFTTLDGKSILTTSPASAITQTNATCGGNIISDGGASIIDRGVCWSTNTDPTTADNKTTDGADIGHFTSSLTDLSPNTIYYVRAFAVSSTGTAYGNHIRFTTLPNIVIPTITTTVPDALTQTTATSGGNITFDGGASISARGVCWSTSQNPTTADNKTTDGNGIGRFASSLTDLSPNTIYFVRAYATNSAGTAYGSQGSFTTLSHGIVVTDIDGNNYSTVSIGKQLWMNENLKTTSFNDWTSINNVTVNADWANLTTPAYCWYNNDAFTYKNTYGALYNWYAVNTGKLCPVGWHVPTDAEWTILTEFLGGASIAGGKLKETGTIHWTGPNTGATNETGFSARPGGGRTDYDGSYYKAGSYCRWWTAEENYTSLAWYRSMDYTDNNVIRNYDFVGCGFSIRCLRDN